MLNNNVALTVQLTDVANAPKNVNGTNKTYNQASDENNYRGWIMNYKPETNLITITGTLVTHSDLICQINGVRDKYVSINADSLSKEIRVTFCIKAPRGFRADVEQTSDYLFSFKDSYQSARNIVVENFNKGNNSFLTINRASSIVYCAETKDQSATLTVFVTFDNLNFSFSKKSFIKKLACLTRKTKTIELS